MAYAWFLLHCFGSVVLVPYCSEFLAPLIMSCVLSIFSLSGCPRAKKGGIKTTPIKDDKEDSELLKFVLHRKPKAFPLFLLYGKKRHNLGGNIVME